MFRTIVVKRSSKLSLIHGYLVIFNGEDEKRILISEISCLLVESNRVSITSPLLIELARSNIAVIFCDEKHNPAITILPTSGYHSQLTSLNTQLNWPVTTKHILWQYIVKAKISMQANVLKMFQKDGVEELQERITEIEEADKTNREGIAAKTYFISLFGKDFSRDKETLINMLLNYGYAILLSCFNREIVSHGYLTQIGIYHKSQYNHFNLSCDFMEPFRPLVDILVMNFLDSEVPKREIRKLLSFKLRINGEERYIDNAISVYTIILLNILKGKETVFPTIELLEKEEYRNAGESDENNSDV